MCEKKRIALFISTVTPTLSSSKMCRNTKADAAVVDIVVRKECKGFNSCFIEKVLNFVKEIYFINLYLYLWYVYFSHAVSTEEF